MSKKALKQNILYAFNGHIIIRVLRAAYIFLLIRILSPEDYGVYQYSHVWFTTYTPLTLMGLGILLSLNVSKENSDKTLPRITFSLRILTSVLLAALLYIIGSYSIDLENVDSLLLLFLPILPIRALLHWGKEICIAYEKMSVHFYTTVVFSSIQIAAVIYLEHIQADLTVITAIYVAILASEVLFLLALINQKILPVRLDFSIGKFFALIKQSWLIALVFMGVKFIVMSPILLSGQMEASEVAILAGITMLIFFASLVIEATNNAALPFLNKQGISLKTMLAFWNAIKFPILVIAGLSALLLAKPTLVTNLLGNGYEAATGYIHYLPILLLLNFISMVMVNVMLVRETQKFLLFSMASACSFLLYKYFFFEQTISSQLSNASIAFGIFILSCSFSFVTLYLNRSK